MGLARCWTGLAASVVACASIVATSGCRPHRATPPASATHVPVAQSAQDGHEDEHEHDGVAVGGADPRGTSVVAQTEAPDPGGRASAEAAFRRPLPALAPQATASRVANLSPKACMAELARLEGVFARSKQAAGGVASPVRTTGPVGGVRIVIPRAPSPFGVLDCRLALAVVELSRVAAEHDVVEIRIDNTHRPKAKLPGKRKPSQHAYGLAADITTFRLADGRTLSVERDWHAPIGAQVCGPDAVLDEPTESAIALRNLVCDIARQGVFHRVLTPGFNAAHKDHLHLDIMRDEKRQIVR